MPGRAEQQEPERRYQQGEPGVVGLPQCHQHEAEEGEHDVRHEAGAGHLELRGRVHLGPAAAEHDVADEDHGPDEHGEHGGYRGDHGERADHGAVA